MMPLMVLPFWTGRKLAVPDITEELFPDAQVGATAWNEIGNLTNSSNLDQFVDETTPADNDGITTESPGGGRFLEPCGAPQDDVSVTLGLPDFTDTPSGNETFVIRVRARLKETFGGGQAEVEVELMKTTSVVNTANPQHTLTTSFANYSESLSSSEIDDLLLDTSDMRFRITARGCVTESGDEVDVEVSQVSLDVF